MPAGILSAIEGLVKEIYTVDQSKIHECFLSFLDELERLMKSLNDMGYQADISEELGKLQLWYEERNLTEISDFLLYNFKPAILGLEEVVGIKITEDEKC